MGWIGAAGAALGAIAGGQRQNQSQEQAVNVAPPSAFEQQLTAGTSKDYGALQGLVGAGAGVNDVAAGAQGQRDLAAMLRQYAAGGFMPGQQDIATAQQFAQTQYQPQQVALQQQQQQEQLKANQLAAQLGRPVNDPIIQAKLAQERAQSQERLRAAQGAFASQFALNLPQQRLGYTAQLADVQSSLASQAMQNRQALLSLGSQLRGQEQQFRLGTTSRTATTSSGGGMAGAISGGLAGLGAGMSVANMFGGGGMGVAGMPTATSAGVTPSMTSQPQMQMQMQLPQFNIPQTTMQQPTQNWGPLNNQSYQSQYGAYNPTGFITQPNAFADAWMPNWRP